MKFNKEKAIECAKQSRIETISELGYLIKGLQKDYDRLVKAQETEDSDFQVEHRFGNKGYYLQQHCNRYEQTIKAATEMEMYARIAEWIEE